MVTLTLSRAVLRAPYLLVVFYFDCDKCGFVLSHLSLSSSLSWPKLILFYSKLAIEHTVFCNFIFHF